MQEIDVIRRTRTFLHASGLQGKNVLELYTDAHPSLLHDPLLRPFQRFTLAFEGFSVHPDLVGRLNDGETTFAIEAKGSADLLKGIAQAEIYRHGFHLVLFACAGQPSRDLLLLARRHTVGVLAVHADQVDILDVPPPHLPQLRHAERIHKQFVAIDSLRKQFYFNLPTHYLCFVPALRTWAEQYGDQPVELHALEPFTRNLYPVLPQGTPSFRAALSGAAKLGMIHLQGNQVRHTFIGQSVTGLLPGCEALAALHRRVSQGGSKQTLAQLEPSLGSVLSCLVYSDPIAKFVIDTLVSIGRREPISLRNLVVVCAERDKAITPTIFFKPEAVPEITDDQGYLTWNRVRFDHFRSTTFMQYKSILKHAGVIKPHPLGGASAKKYDPDKDIWELM